METSANLPKYQVMGRLLNARQARMTPGRKVGGPMEKLKRRENGERQNREDENGQQRRDGREAGYKNKGK